MMDESVKPGDGRKRSVGCEICIMVTKCLLCPIWWPLMLVFYMPIAMAAGCGKAFAKDCDWCGWLIGIPFGFVFGLILNICWIPVFIIGSFCFFMVMLCMCIGWCMKGCKIDNLPDQQAE